MKTQLLLISFTYRILVAVERGYPVYISLREKRSEMEAAGIPMAGYSLVAQANYAGALNRQFARVVSCNTTAFTRVLLAQHRHGWVKCAWSVRATWDEFLSEGFKGHEVPVEPG